MAQTKTIYKAWFAQGRDPTITAVKVPHDSVGNVLKLTRSYLSLKRAKAVLINDMTERRNELNVQIAAIRGLKARDLKETADVF